MWLFVVLLLSFTGAENTYEKALKHLIENDPQGPLFEEWLRSESNNYQWREFDFTMCDISMNETVIGKPLPWMQRAEIEFCQMKSTWFLSQLISFPGKPQCDALLKNHLLMSWRDIPAKMQLGLMRCMRQWLAAQKELV
jgi:hypothetical protein